ncbi:hypothetical protein [Alicyclobacillus ferrooxydans]|uniref:Uncharacterized protein n=1 Tax=Alicyclobacillus ferrooxydans TaxID=471514 RepID=A0A0P9ETC6_9BACL|nr:hypothetical protein [Alicyclobacillus ferrooxydans]KPV42038.1 hypothetical protein AN477_19915 [Alicyclobacillus ferrooxydans]
MSWWNEAVIGVPRVTWKKIEDLVDEVYYMEQGDELESHERRDLAERLAVHILEEYVQQYFGESAKVAAEMFRQRRRERQKFLG